jgi:hypothetical protein
MIGIAVTTLALRWGASSPTWARMPASQLRHLRRASSDHDAFFGVFRQPYFVFRHLVAVCTVRHGLVLRLPRPSAPQRRLAVGLLAVIRSLLVEVSSRLGSGVKAGRCYRWSLDRGIFRITMLPAFGCLHELLNPPSPVELPQ